MREKVTTINRKTCIAYLVVGYFSIALSARAQALSAGAQALSAGAQEVEAEGPVSSQAEQEPSEPPAATPSEDDSLVDAGPEETSSPPNRNDVSRENHTAEQSMSSVPHVSVPSRVVVYQDDKGFKLNVDGRDFMIFGMNWGYIPIGKNYSYSLWSQPESFIREVLDREMPLLKQMGINAIRLFDNVPPKWVRYIHQQYGIYTVVNHMVGRYGMDIGATWTPHTNYQDPQVRALLKQSVLDMVQKYHNVPGVLLFILGNENNYGLHWSSFEIERLPAGNREQARATYLYSLYGEIIDEMKKVDRNHPVAIANGDLQYIDLIAKHCPNLDIMAANVYRGASMRDLYDEVQKKLGLPVFFSEFGADAYNARTQKEDHISQALYLKEQWKEIYEQSYGKGRVGNALGGFIFQWSDEWWKVGQEENLYEQDTSAGWPNEDYPHDYVKGTNNMNEEWWGIAAKGKTDDNGYYQVYPRTAYFILKEAFTLDPYAGDTDLAKIREHFDQLMPGDYSLNYDVTGLERRLTALEKMIGANLRMQFETITTGNRKNRSVGKEGLTFDHLESFYTDFKVKPTEKLEGFLSLNILGHVPTNKMNEIFYENRGERFDIKDTTGERRTIEDNQRVEVYQASFDWDNDWFRLEGFYRTGHNHWGHEGDFFGLYPEAHYGPNIDIYHAITPFGAEFTGKRFLDGVKVAFGPQLYWGANPAVIAKYYKEFGSFRFGLMHQEDIAEQGVVSSSFVVPEPVTRKTTLYFSYQLGPVRLELGGIFAGSEKVGRSFLSAEKAGGATYMNSGYYIAEDEIIWADTLGTKAKLTLQKGIFNWYLESAYKGLVADGGPDQTITFTGWSLKPDGRGNQFNVASGLALSLAKFVIAPNFLYQRPLEAPLPKIDDFYDIAEGKYYPAVVPRNTRDHPFAVLGNRETIGFELMLVFDPTPGTWFWKWDRDDEEDAVFAAALDFAYRIQPTSRDSFFGFTEDGDMFSFDDAPPAHDEWDVTSHLVFNPHHDVRLLGKLYTGQGQAKGSSERLVWRSGFEGFLKWQKLALRTFVKIHDWGPYDYHRDFNQTFPLQIMADISYGLSLPKILSDYTRFGIRYQQRFSDHYSPDYPYEDDEDVWYYEYEFVTYLNITL